MTLVGQLKSGHSAQNFGEAWMKGETFFIVGVAENKNVLENEVL